MAPPPAPNRNPIGPVMKRPSKGPWLAPGAKTSGPKNPAENPTAPVTSAPTTTELTRPEGAEAERLQTTHPARNAQSSEPRYGIHSDRSPGMISENGSQYTT